MLPWIWVTSSAGRRHVVLDEAAALEHGDLGGARASRARTSGSGRRAGPCARGPGAARGSPRRARPGSSSDDRPVHAARAGLRLRSAAGPGRRRRRRRRAAVVGRPAPSRRLLGRRRGRRPGVADLRLAAHEGPLGRLGDRGSALRSGGPGSSGCVVVGVVVAAAARCAACRVRPRDGCGRPRLPRRRRLAAAAVGRRGAVASLTASTCGPASRGRLSGRLRRGTDGAARHRFGHRGFPSHDARACVAVRRRRVGSRLPSRAVVLDPLVRAQHPHALDASGRARAERARRDASPGAGSPSSATSATSSLGSTRGRGGAPAATADVVGDVLALAVAGRP